MRCPARIIGVALSLLVGATASAQDLQIVTTEGRWISDIEPTAVREGRLIYLEDGLLVSIVVDDVDLLRRETRNHGVGALLGLGGGLFVGVVGGGAVVYAELFNGWQTGGAIGLGVFVASAVAGMYWGASAGVRDFQDVALSLEGLDYRQRVAALERFVLDEELRRMERSTR